MEVKMAKRTFSHDIRPLFRSYDVESMKPYGIDLSSYKEVRSRAGDIYSRLQAKDMPCDGGWSGENLLKFKEWMEGGMEP
jgi:hypothetical protein